MEQYKNNIFEKITSVFNKVEPSQEKQTTEETSYFDKSKFWADECYAKREVTLSWFKLGFGLSSLLNVLLVITVLGLSNVQKLVPLIVHQYENGVTTVEAIDDDAPQNKAQVESDLVRYIQTRESYDSSAYKSQFDLTNLLSSENVAVTYQREQSKTNRESPINTLGLNKIRKVHVYDIHFLDSILNKANENQKENTNNNVAEVVYSISDIDKLSGKEITKTMTALVSWEYLGTPKNPRERWQNYSGFKVTNYQTQQRNVEKG
jgi:type IV secretion system protein VirB8